MRLEGQRAPVTSHRFVQPTLVLERVAQIVVNLGLVRAERHGLFIMGYCGWQVACGLEGDSDVVVSVGAIGGKGQRPREMRDRRVGFAVVAERGAEADQSIDMVGPLRECALVLLGRAAQLAAFAECARTVDKRLDGAGSEREGLLVTGYRFVELSVIVQRGAEIVEDLDRSRPQSGCPPEITYRLFRSSEILAEVAEVVERVDQIRFDSERPLVALRGLVFLPGVSQHIAEVVVKVRVSGVDRDRLTDMADGNLGMTLVMGQQSEHMKAVSVVGIEGKDLTVAPLGIGEVPGSVAAQRRLEHGGERGAATARRRGWGIPSLSGRGAALLSVHGCSVLPVWFGSDSAAAKIKFRQLVPLRDRQGVAASTRRRGRSASSVRGAGRHRASLCCLRAASRRRTNLPPSGHIHLGSARAEIRLARQNKGDPRSRGRRSTCGRRGNRPPSS